LPHCKITSEVTVTLPPPPTETLVPTPTVHPQFLEWQESIAALSERFALMPDGSIQDNGVPVPGVRVSPDGVMTLTLADGTEMTLDSSDVSFDDDKGFGVEGYELDSDLGTWDEEVAGYTLEQLAEMSPSEIISLAPEVPEIERPEWAVGEKVSFSREVVNEHIVTLLADGRQYGAYDLLTGEMYDGVSVYQADPGIKPTITLFKNDSESLGELPDKYFNVGEDHRLSEAIFALSAINAAYYRLEDSSGQRLLFEKMLNDNATYHMSTVKAQWDYYNRTIKPAFIKALKDGSIWEGEERNWLTIGDQQIVNQMPVFVVTRGRDSVGVPTFEDGDTFDWVMPDGV
jgi:hypothetical protein